jgi:hypothetical protein
MAIWRCPSAEAPQPRPSPYHYREHSFSAVNSRRGFREHGSRRSPAPPDHFREHHRRATGLPHGAGRSSAVGRDQTHVPVQGAGLSGLAGRRRTGRGPAGRTAGAGLGRSASTAPTCSPSPNAPRQRSTTPSPRWMTSIPAAASDRPPPTGSTYPPRHHGRWMPRPRCAGCAPSKITPHPGTGC